MKKAPWLSILISTVLLSACATSHIVQPLNKSQWQVGLEFGGPLIHQNQQTKITPLTAVNGAYGITQKVTGFASWYPSSYLNDVFQWDAGITQELLAPFSIRPGITYSGALNLFSTTRIDKVRVFPQLDINTYWLLPNEDFVYLGLSNWFDLSRQKAHGVSQENHWFTSLNLGYTKRFKPYAFTLEGRYLAPLHKPEENLVDFVNFHQRGATGLYFSVSRVF